MSDYKKHLVIEGMDELAAVIRDNGLDHFTLSLSRFYTAYNNINQGCGCAKKKRIKEAEQHYRALADEHPEAVRTMQSVFMAIIIQFNLNGEEIFRWS